MRLGRRNFFYNLRYGLHFAKRKNKNIRNRNKNRKRFSPFLLIIFIVSVIAYFCITFVKETKPLVISIAEVKARYIANNAINEAVYDIIKDENITYNKLVQLQKNSAGHITALQTDMIVVNKLKAQIAIGVQNKIASIDTAEIRVSLSNLIDNNMFYDWGPMVPIRLMTLGSAQTDFKSSFSSAGINQTKHEVSIVVKSRVRVVLPIITSSVEVITTVPIAETIIIGEVPSQYLNLGSRENIGILRDKTTDEEVKENGSTDKN